MPGTTKLSKCCCRYDGEGKLAYWCGFCENRTNQGIYRKEAEKRLDLTEDEELPLDSPGGRR